MGFGIFAYAVDADLLARAFGSTNIGDDAFLIDANGFGIVAGTIIILRFDAGPLET